MNNHLINGFLNAKLHDYINFTNMKPWQCSGRSAADIPFRSQHRGGFRTEE